MRANYETEYRNAALQRQMERAALQQEQERLRAALHTEQNPKLVSLRKQQLHNVQLQIAAL